MKMKMTKALVERCAIALCVHFNAERACGKSCLDCREQVRSILRESQRPAKKGKRNG